MNEIACLPAGYTPSPFFSSCYYSLTLKKCVSAELSKCQETLPKTYTLYTYLSNPCWWMFLQFFFSCNSYKIVCETERQAGRIIILSEKSPLGYFQLCYSSNVVLNIAWSSLTGATWIWKKKLFLQANQLALWRRRSFFGLLFFTMFAIGYICIPVFFGCYIYIFEETMYIYITYSLIPKYSSFHYTFFSIIPLSPSIVLSLLPRNPQPSIQQQKLLFVEEDTRQAWERKERVSAFHKTILFSYYQNLLSWHNKSILLSHESTLKAWRQLLRTDDDVGTCAVHMLATQVIGKKSYIREKSLMTDFKCNILK